MSDFDKEAEREKLREKYERDKQKREATEQMSELLLKGATMTNSHCGTCGDPIFRYEGQEFCPTCEEVVTEQPAEGDTDREGSEDGVESDQPTSGSEQSTADSAGQPAGSDPQPTENGTADATDDVATDTGLGDTERTDTGLADTEGPPEATPSEQQAGPSSPPQPKSQPVDSTPESSVSGGEQPARTDATPATTSASGGETPTGTERVGSLATARASLTRTVTRLAQQAEGADDLERARAYLAATEEAADALAAVKEADR